MHAFDGENRMQKFDTAESIADAFFPIRLSLYRDRKSLLESESFHSATTLRNKARFIEVVTNGQIELVSGRKSKDETSAELRNLGFTTATELIAIKNNNAAALRRRIPDEVREQDDVDPVRTRSEFDYLLNMPLSSLTSERIDELRKEASRKDDELQQIRSTTAEDLWHKDLDTLTSMLKD
jgi:DNA topoisomerase-2